MATAEPTAVVDNDFAASKDKKEERGETASAEEGKEEPSDKDDDEEEKKKYSKKDEEEKEEEKKSEENSDAPTDEKKDEEEDEKKKYALLETDFTALQEKYSELEVKYNELVAFKAQVEDAKKDEMIAKFYFLSDEDKKEVVENKSKYTIDEIESKLSVICVRNKVNFDLDNSSKNDNNTEETVVTTFTMANEVPSVPAWIAAVKNNQKK